MKFILNSSIDTLPTKVNLKQWGKVSNDKCFCGKRQTLFHILNGCKKCLEDGRYTFRHDSVLSYIDKCLDKEKFECFIDIEGSKRPGGGTLPPKVIVTALKPDIVIIDNKTKSVNIFELTVPGEKRIDVAHKLKTEKYQHFLTDIANYKPSLTPFEVGSSTGYISQRNKQHLNVLHKFCKKNLKLSQFKDNISAIAILGSFYIFNSRNEKNWEPVDHILPPLN